MQRALSALKQAAPSSSTIDAPALDADQLIAENDVQKYEFKAVMDRYLASIPNAPKKTVDSIFASGRYNHPTLEGFLNRRSPSRTACPSRITGPAPPRREDPCASGEGDGRQPA